MMEFPGQGQGVTNVNVVVDTAALCALVARVEQTILGELSEMEARLFEAAEGNFEDITRALNALEDTLMSLSDTEQAAFTAFTDSISKVETDLGSLYDRATQQNDKLHQTIDDLETQIGTLTTTDAADQATIDQLNKTVADLRAQAEAHSAEVVGALGSLSDTLANIDTGVTAFEATPTTAAPETPTESTTAAPETPTESTTPAPEPPADTTAPVAPAETLPNG
jgi:ABC-type transporter Mla subunit MlaD